MVPDIMQKESSHGMQWTVCMLLLASLLLMLNPTNTLQLLCMIQSQYSGLDTCPSHNQPGTSTTLILEQLLQLPAVPGCTIHCTGASLTLLPDTA
jgi:hypothetical protein